MFEQSVGFKLNYKEVTQQTEELVNVAMKINQEKENLYSYYMGIQKNWKCEHADLYLEKMKKRIEGLEELERKIRNAARVIEEVTTNIKNVEGEVEKIVRTRSV